MNAKELNIAVAELRQQVRELREIINAQGAEITALRKQRAPVPAQQHAHHIDREQRLLAVARLSARYPSVRSFTPQQVEAEIADAEFAKVCPEVGDPE